MANPFSSSNSRAFQGSGHHRRRTSQPIQGNIAVQLHNTFANYDEGPAPANMDGFQSLHDGPVTGHAVHHHQQPVPHGQLSLRASFVSGNNHGTHGGNGNHHGNHHGNHGGSRASHGSAWLPSQAGHFIPGSNAHSMAMQPYIPRASQQVPHAPATPATPPTGTHSRLKTLATHSSSGEQIVASFVPRYESYLALKDRMKSVRHPPTRAERERFERLRFELQGFDREAKAMISGYMLDVAAWKFIMGRRMRI